jgi:HEAT repeat protein
MMLRKKRVILFFIALAVFWIGVIGWFYQTMLGPGFTKRETARILVHDDKFGMRAKQKAIRYGDAIVPLIKAESDDFKKLNSRNAIWIAEVLGSIQTEDARKILKDLYSRTGDIHRLTGAMGLAQQGIFPDRINEGSFLVETVRSDKWQEGTELAIIALGRTKDPNALPCLLDVLRKRPLGYWHHAYACQAVARIQLQEAVPVLRDCLKSDTFYALPDAFRALITLGDRQAVPLAIARIAPGIKDYNSGFVVSELEKVTGKDYGYDRAKWEKWWDEVKDVWQIPEAFTKPWDDQPKNH